MAEECNWGQPLPKMTAVAVIARRVAPKQSRASRGFLDCFVALRAPRNDGGGPSPCICRNVKAAETDQTPDFLLPNYNKCKNSDTPWDDHRKPVQQKGFKKVAAGGVSRAQPVARGRFVYMNDFSGLPLTGVSDEGPHQAAEKPAVAPDPAFCRNNNHIAAKICGFPDSSNRE
jgi:hypothetical protein